MRRQTVSGKMSGHIACSSRLQGGIVGKERHFRQKGKPFLLTVEDPQQPGTDIGSGAFNISQVVSPTRDSSACALRHLP